MGLLRLSWYEGEEDPLSTDFGQRPTAWMQVLLTPELIEDVQHPGTVIQITAHQLGRELGQEHFEYLREVNKHSSRSTNTQDPSGS